MAQEITVAEQLKQLYELQLIDSKIDEIEILKGELPIEVSDLEDDIAGLEIRIGKLRNTIKELQSNISKQQANIQEAETMSRITANSKPLLRKLNCSVWKYSFRKRK